MKWNKFVDGTHNGANRFFDELVEKKQTTEAPAAGGGAEKTELIGKIVAAPTGDRRTVLLAHLQALLSKILGRDSIAGADLGKGFMDLGLDSLMGVEFRNKLKKDLGDLGKHLSPTLVFDYPNLNAVADFLFKEVLKDVVQSKSAAGKADAKPAKKRKAGAANEPIAIVGASCRLPGGIADLDSYWQLLRQGGDAITEVPKERWDIDALYDADVEAPGKMSSRFGGFLKDVDKFDPEFFEMSPQEASEIDPQQRMLLETAWEAIESSGIDSSTLKGSRTAVYLGVGNYDYGRLHVAHRSRDLTGYFGIGTLPPAMAGRLSFFFGFQGPCFVLDTACSGSLIAIHQACASLRSMESDMALAGGINMMLSPDISISFSHAHMLSPVGRCKTFDDSADGYVRAEGCGIVVLKRLSDAEADGDRILAVIRGTATNQDGRSGSLTAPNGPSQEALLRDSLQNAGIKAADVSFFEAHGTGTALGDPIEVYAAGRVLREERTAENPLYLGSHKANIGHAEAAAGVAGVLKIALCLINKELPPQVHFKKLNTKISLDEIPAKIPLTLTPWKPVSGRRIATVSSFGFTGSNVNAVIEEAPPPKQEHKVGAIERPSHVLCLSGKTEAALMDLLKKYQKLFTDSPEINLADVCHTAAIGRVAFAERIAITAPTVSEMRRKIEAYLGGSPMAGVVRGRVSESQSPRVAFLFTGQGSQYSGMAKQLYETQPTFKASLDRCAAILSKQMDRPLFSVIFENEKSGVIDETRYTQPALFAIEYALYELWKSWGLEPSAVIGHSVGEVVAATVAGVFTLEDGLKLICKRGEIMGNQSGRGGMIAIMASESEAAAAIAPHASRVSIAAVNGPKSVVISGYEDSLAEVAKGLEAKGIKTKRLSVSHGFHSQQMDSALADFEAFLGGLAFADPQIKLISNSDGKAVSAADIKTPKYWSRHIRNAVRFADGIVTLHSEGFTHFLEVGPGTALVGMGRACVSDESESTSWIPSLKRERGDWDQMLEAVSSLFVSGVAVDWKAFEKDSPARRRVSIPTYPFQRKRCWIKPSELAVQLASGAAVLSDGQSASSVKESARQRLSDEVQGKSREAALDIIGNHLKGEIRTLLGVDSVDNKKNLVALGLDSLMTIRLRSIVAKIAKELGHQGDLPGDLFDFTTVEKLTRFLSESQPSQQGSATKSPAQVVAIHGADKDVAKHRWVARFGGRPDAKIRVFCFPYAGGSSAVFSNWAAKISEEVELCAIRLPGRMGRLDEAAPGSLDALADGVADSLSAFFDKPYAIVGYSFGALLAYETMKRIRKSGQPMPLRFFAMASAAPTKWVAHRGIHQLPDEQFLEKLMSTYGYEGMGQAFADKDVRAVVLPILRSEIKMVETYDAKNAGEALPISISAYVGKSDPVCGIQQAEGWKSFAGGGFDLKQFAGGHFFLQSAEAQCLGALETELIGLIGQSGELARMK